jgi:hypothetical protein
MGELNTTLHRLSLEQHMLAGIFLLGYGCALGSMFGPKARLRWALLASMAALAFAARTDPWQHGVLLVGGAMGSVAIFIALAWTICQVGARSGMSARAAAFGRPQRRHLPKKLRDSTLQTAQAARRRRRRARTV